MSPNDLVSIITPAFNAARFVSDAIRSVHAQDYQSWEMLIVDDCSPDATADRIAEWTQRDSRVRLIRQKQNGGPAAARNAALAASTGRYVAFLDSDDAWLPKKLSRQIGFIRSTGAALSFTSYRRISADGTRTGRLISPPKSLTYSQLLCNTAIATSSAVVDCSITGPLQMRKVYYDDFVLWLEVLRQGHVAFGLSEDLMRYRVVANSVSRNKINSAKEVWNTYRLVEQLGVLRSTWCFGNYAARATLKYARF